MRGPVGHRSWVGRAMSPWRASRAKPLCGPTMSTKFTFAHNGLTTASPVGRREVLEELSPHVAAGVEAADDGIDDACGAVDGVEGWMEALLDGFSRGDLRRVLVGHPSRVDAVHVDAVRLVVGSRRARHHV